MPLCRLLPITCSRSRKPRHRDSDTAPTRFSLSPPSRKIEGATTSYCCTQDPLGESEVMCGAELRGNASTHAPALVLKTLRSELGSPRPRSCAAEPRASRCCVYALLSGTHVIACVLLRSQARAPRLAGNGCRADSPVARALCLATELTVLCVSNSTRAVLTWRPCRRQRACDRTGAPCRRQRACDRTGACQRK